MFSPMLRLPSVARRDAICRDEASALMHFVGVGKYIGAGVDLRAACGTSDSTA